MSNNTVSEQLSVPDINDAQVAFGDIKHMPKYETLPESFQDWHDEKHCRAIGKWFFSGATGSPNGITIDGKTYTAKPGVDANKALRAIKAVLGSWSPKHEHKMAACGYMLSQWFEERTP